MLPRISFFLLINGTAEIKIAIIMIEEPNRINGFMYAK
jgi:hypothetical protein